MPTLTAVTLSNDELAAVDAFYWQKVFYNGKAVRRWELIPVLAATPGMTEEAALFHLVSAEIVGPPVVAFDDAAGDDGWRTTKSGHHIHIDGDGNIDKGNPHVVREAAGRLGHAALRGAKAVGGLGLKAAGAVGKAGLKVAGRVAAKGLDIGKHVAKEAVTSAVEIGRNALKDGASATDALGEIAIRNASKAVKGGLKLGAKAAGAVAKGGLKLAGKAAGAVARKVGSGIAGVLKGAWRKVTSVKMSADTRRAVTARFAA